MSRRRVALFRGINVGKAKRIAMADLRIIAVELGYLEVSTLLNSGNLVFTLPAESKGDAAALIEKALKNKLGIVSRVTLLTGDEVAEIVEQNPFHKIAADHSRLLITVLTDPESRGRLGATAKQDWGREKVFVGTRAVYAWCPDSILESPLFKALGKAVGDGATTRNFATMTKLHALCTAVT